MEQVLPQAAAGMTLHFQMHLSGSQSKYETTESFFDFLKYFVRALPDSDMSEKLLNPLTLFYRKNTYGFMTRKPSVYFFFLPLNK